MINFPSELLSIDRDLDLGGQIVDCTWATSQIVTELVDRAKEIPVGVKVFICRLDEAIDPHTWLRVELDNGATWIWDKSGQKIHGNSLVEINQAIKAWSEYAHRDNAVQVIPLTAN